MAIQTAAQSANSSEHIKELAKIDQDVVSLLRYAGQAVDALAFAQSDDPNGSNDPADFEQRKKDFSSAASQYFDTLYSVDTSLRRQINALRSSDIIPAESHTKEPRTQQDTSAFMSGMGAPDPSALKQATLRSNPITGGGLGKLDIGWLNSRNDNVAREMEAELWEGAQRSVEGFEVRRLGVFAPQPRPEEGSSMTLNKEEAREPMDQS